jgi:hypothetical protein
MNIFTGNLPQGFRYVPQDNYLLCKPDTAGLDYLYADSATSCIIVIVTGENADGDTLIAVSHLSCEVRFKAFFELIERSFKGYIKVHAAGANPPWEKECIKNARTFMQWVASLSHARFTVALGSGLPNSGFGAYGINVLRGSPCYLEVSNKYFHIPDDRLRDPEDGANILFCKLGLRTGLPSLILRDTDVPFTEAEKAALVAEAEKQNWSDVLAMTDEEILEKYSTTPQYEPAWFAGSIRRAAEFIREYNRLN